MYFFKGIGIFFVLKDYIVQLLRGFYLFFLYIRIRIKREKKNENVILYIYSFKFECGVQVGVEKLSS